MLSPPSLQSEIIGNLQSTLTMHLSQQPSALVRCPGDYHTSGPVQALQARGSSLSAAVL